MQLLFGVSTPRAAGNREIPVVSIGFYCIKLYLCIDDWNKESLKVLNNPHTLELFEDGIENSYFKFGNKNIIKCFSKMFKINFCYNINEYCKITF